MSFIAGAGKSYVAHIYTDSAGTSELLNKSYVNAYSSPQNIEDEFTGLSAGTYYVEVKETASPTACSKHSIVVAATAASTTVRYMFRNSDAVDPSILVYDHSFAHIPNTDITIPTTGVGPDIWFFLEYPAAESDFAHWYNTDTNYGNIDDFIFDVIITIGSKKYIKSRRSFTLDPAVPLKLKH